LVAIKNFPFYITLFSLFLPFIVSQFHIEMHRVLLVGVLFIYISRGLLKGRLLTNNKYINASLIFFITLVIIDLILGRGLRTFSYSHIYLYIFIFCNIFIFEEKNINSKMLINQSNTIFKVLIVCLVIEFLFLLTGNFNLLQMIYPETGMSIVEGFRSYHNRFGSYFNLNIEGLNSLITGNQIANIIALLSMIWFAPFYIFKPRQNRYLWFVISFFLFLFSPTITGTGLFLFSTLIFFTFLKNSSINSLKKVSPILFLLIIIGLVSYEFIFLPLINNSFMTAWYIYGFIYPIQNYFNLDLFYLIMGHSSESFADNFYSNEIGIIRLAMKIGMPLIVVVAISIITTFLKSNLLFSKEYISTLLLSKNFEEYKNYSFLAQTNILIIIIWVLSTFHYLTIFRLGAVQLIAFQFTVSVFSLYKSNKIIKIVKDKI
jgi:hypothetical protein